MTRPTAPPPGHTVVGQVVGPHGIKGGLRVSVLTDFPERFDRGRRLWLDGTERRVVETTWHKGQARLVLEGVATVEEVERLKWSYLTVPDTDRPKLDDDVFYAKDLLGCEVVTPEGTLIGSLDEVVHAPAHDLLRVGQALVPAVSEFVLQIDLSARRIVVRPIPGLFDDSEAEVAE